ncbi:hypothetical protein AYK26_00060 [Euryarchaeota archaeon SM23-78]|nr:MAG: hypothetical protein AYK26_00060 [Euryarchaeota archaeon SM23-78]MBW3000529.1 hypothetical protein [Candidatus Woesearchaeota archaeon]
MEIKIDTKKDSPEDIKKAIELLQRIVEASEEYGSSKGDSGSDVASGMVGLFGDTPVLGDDYDDDDEDKDEEEKERIQIIPY